MCLRPPPPPAQARACLSMATPFSWFFSDHSFYGQKRNGDDCVPIVQGKRGWGTANPAALAVRPAARNLGIYHGIGGILPCVNCIIEWGVVIALFLSVLSIVPCYCARLTNFLHPKLRKINTVLITTQLITLALQCLRRAGSIPWVMPVVVPPAHHNILLGTATQCCLF